MCPLVLVPIFSTPAVASTATGQCAAGRLLPCSRGEALRQVGLHECRERVFEEPQCHGCERLVCEMARLETVF